MRIRPASARDTAAMAALYAHHVLRGFGSFEEAPPSSAEMTERLAAVEARGLPWLVAEGEDGELLGYAYAGPFRTRAAYRHTAETSIYIAAGREGQGIGRALLAEIVEACRAAGVRQLLALIGDSANAGSIALHAALGFAHVGVMRDVGFKNARWLDVVVMQKQLTL